MFFRSRNENGELREKRGDTHVGTIEKKYHVDLGVRGDMHLDTLMERKGVESLNDLLHGNPSNRYNLQVDITPGLVLASLLRIIKYLQPVEIPQLFIIARFIIREPG